MVKYAVIESGICTCKNAPQGEYGLEGYNLEDEYKYEWMKDNSTGKKHYRVYPDCDMDYRETCGPIIFNRYFKKEVKNDIKTKNP